MTIDLDHKSDEICDIQNGWYFNRRGDKVLVQDKHESRNWVSRGNKEYTIYLTHAAAVAVAVAAAAAAADVDAVVDPYGKLGYNYIFVLTPSGRVRHCNRNIHMFDIIGVCND